MVRPSNSHLGHGAVGLDQPAGDGDEVLGRHLALEPDEVAGQQSPQHLLAPRQPHVQLLGREGDVEEEPDADVGSQLAQEQGHELEVVVVHPHHGAFGRLGRRRLGEALVDPDVALPPRRLERRAADGVVVERPQRLVGEPVVELADVVFGQGDRHEPDAVTLERRRRVAGRARPTDPCAAPMVQHRNGGAHQASWARLPVVAVLRPLNGEAIGHDDQLVAAPFAHDLLTLPNRRAPRALVRSGRVDPDLRTGGNAPSTAASPQGRRGRRRYGHGAARR